VAEGGGVKHAIEAGSAALDVFISYASPDSAVADALCEALEREGVTCWIAPRDVVPGEFYADAIVRAIDASKVIVLVLSQNAVTSQHVLREVERASSKRHPVVSFRVDLAPLPAALEYFLNTSHWLDASASGVDRALPRLVEAVKHLVAPVSLMKSVPQGGAAQPDSAPSPRPPVVVQSNHRLSRIGIVLSVAIALGLTYFIADKFWLSKHVAAVQPDPSLASLRPAAAPAAPAISGNSIAVLPFADMSEKKDQEYFSDGLSEELIDLLAKTQGLAVIARTSSFYFKGKQVTIAEIAKTLNVAHVLEGSVRKAGNTIRVTAQLIRAQDGVQIWSETYNRDFKDVFRVQDDISAAVVAALKIQLLSSPPTVDARSTANTEAYNQYLLGRQFYHRSNVEGFRRAVQSYRKAVELDPDYAAAYAGLSRAELLLAEFTDFGAGVQRAVAAADKAIALAPNLADGYAARGLVRRFYLLDFVGAQSDLEKAVAIDPGDSNIQAEYGGALATVGRMPEAEAAFRAAARLDPLSSDAWAGVAGALIKRKQFPAAREALDRALDINSESTIAQVDVAILELAQGRGTEALAAARKIGIDALRLTYVALAEHTLGHANESEQALNELETRFANLLAYQVAEIYAWRGEKAKAYEWLERAYRQHDAGLSYLEGDSFLDELRGDEEFKAFLRKMKLPA
jgi:TolB-like protein/Tfp pilus assembly protein PilF